jgi:hypothetical protein
MSYEQKYLKYKEKYITLKSKMQKGSGFPFIRTDAGTFTLMLVFTGNTLDRINQRRTSLGLLPNVVPLHMTLLQLHINFAHPDHTIFLQPAFYQCVLQAVRNILDPPPPAAGAPPVAHLELRSGQGSYDILGQNAERYWAREYQFNVQLITDFRREFYNCINTRLTSGRLTHRPNQRRDHGSPTQYTNYDVYDNAAGELYAINHDHYFGAQNWRPHISIFRLNEFNPHSTPPPPPNRNNNLYPILIDPQTTIVNKNNAVLQRITDNRARQRLGRVDPISTLDIRRDMRSIIIAIRHPYRPSQPPQIDTHPFIL